LEQELFPDQILHVLISSQYRPKAIGSLSGGLTLHIRRRRYLDADDKSVILSEFPIKADGTSISPEFADFLKKRS
jgi:hypothetical protein